MSTAAQLGRLLYRTTMLVDELLSRDQVYDSACGPRIGGQSVHIRYVVETVTSTLTAQRDALGQWLRVRMLDHAKSPDASDVEAFAERARHAFSRMNSSGPRCNPVEQP